MIRTMAEALPVGAILGGGRARRMGGRPKPLLELGGERLVDRAARRLSPQVDDLVVATNDDPAGGLAWCPDRFGGGLGPLAGLHAAMGWAREHHPEARAMVTVPVDAPFFPDDLVARLVAQGAPAGVRAGGRMHWVFALWPVDAEEEIERRLVSKEDLSIHGLARALGANVVLFEDAEAFFNINTPADLKRAGEMNKSRGPQ